ncbi:MAG TPA: DUF4011 domain-containing protein, partial [Thermoanaerobaculia bacterium]|nr:DUF4011 domain-containing protein [Thermoanaerobaculia bacterium]
MAPEIEERVSQALAAWRKGLLDLGRKNPLLYYRTRKTSSLEVSSPDVFAVVDELGEDGSGWEVFLPPVPSGEAQDKVAGLPEGGNANEGLIDLDADDETGFSDSFEAGEMTSDAEEGVLVFAPKGRKDLEKRLRNLRRRSETDLNERGVHVLYLAAGFLEWKDPSSNEAVQSPLILFPVSLEQESLFDPWRVSPAGEEETLLNPALRQKMLQDFHLALPDLPPADEADRSDGGALCRQYFEDVRQFLARSALAGWRVIESGILDLFSFHKLVMYRDLEQNAGRAASHDVIRGLASQAGAETATSAGGGFPDDKELDRRLPYKDQFHVLDADSSQLAVLEAARKGTSLVLQGPPGTGKSQTIANLIAQSVADGKKVLFVSEKMAALKVVKKRLADAGLDDLCLELHSHKTNRKLVVEQLARSLDESLIVEGGSRLSGEDLARLEDRRRALREYVEELHRRREPLGRSVGSVLGELARLHTAPARPLPDVDAIKLLDADAFVAVQQFIDTIADYWHVVQEGEGHPWNGLRPDTHGFQLTVTLENELQLLEAVLTELRDRGSELAGQLGYSAPKAAATTFGLADLARLLEKSPGVWKGLFTDPGGNDSALGRGKLLSVRAGQLRSRVAEYFPATEPDAPPTADNLWRVREDLKAALAPFGVGVPLPTGLGPLAERLRAVSGGAERLQQAVKALSVELGLTVPVDDAGRLRGLVSVCRAILAGRPFSVGFFVAESLRTARARLKERSSVWARG